MKSDLQKWIVIKDVYRHIAVTIDHRSNLLELRIDGKIEYIKKFEEEERE